MKDILAAIALVAFIAAGAGWHGGVRGAYPALTNSFKTR